MLQRKKTISPSNKPSRSLIVESNNDKNDNINKENETLQNTRSKNNKRKDRFRPPIIALMLLVIVLIALFIFVYSSFALHHNDDKRLYQIDFPIKLEKTVNNHLPRNKNNNIKIQNHTTTTTRNKNYIDDDKNNDNNQKSTTTASTTTNSSTSDNDIHQDCLKLFQYNSQQWLNGTRLSNAFQQQHQQQKVQTTTTTTTTNSSDDIFLFLPEMLMTTDLISHRDKITQMTICHPNSSFRTLSMQSNLYDWEFQLLYLSIHSMFHQPAQQEWQLRQQYLHLFKTNKKCQSLYNNNNDIIIQPWDFECPNSKYLVTQLPFHGMGASIRLGAVEHVLTAIALNRIPIFVANIKDIPHANTPWSLSSCSRRDWQCVFWSPSPCIITKEQLIAAPILNHVEAYMARETGGHINQSLYQEVVLFLESTTGPAKYDTTSTIESMNKVRQNLHQQAMKLIQQYSMSQKVNAENNANIKNNVSGIDDNDVIMLQKAAKRILDPDPIDSFNHYDFGHRHYRVAHAILLYLLRPNPTYNNILKERMESILIQHSSLSLHTINSNNKNDNKDSQPITLGIPIRASDKCRLESTCLQFNQYLNLAQDAWKEITNDNNNSNNNTNLSYTNKNNNHHYFSSPTTMKSKNYYYFNLIITTEDKRIFRAAQEYALKLNKNTTTVTKYSTTTSNSSSSSVPFNIILNEQDVTEGSGYARAYGSLADDIMASSLTAIQIHLFLSQRVYTNCCSNFHTIIMDLLRSGCGIQQQQQHHGNDDNDNSNNTTSLSRTGGGICLQETKNYKVCCYDTKTTECDAIRQNYTFKGPLRIKPKKKIKRQHGKINDIKQDDELKLII